MTYLQFPKPFGVTTIPSTIIQTAPATHTSLADAFKPKRAGKKTSHVIFVLDDSWSMQSCRQATISGYNEYLELQKQDQKNTGIKTFVSLYKFDGRNVNRVFDRVPVESVEGLTEKTYNPQGMTNLYDAIGDVMMLINTRLAANKKSARDSVIITVLTDGYENASRTFNNHYIKQMIEKAEGKNWGFMFLGANINAFEAGASLGFNVNNTMQYDTASMGNTMRSASAMTARMKAAYASDMNTTLAYAASGFTEEERTSAVAKDGK